MAEDSSTIIGLPSGTIEWSSDFNASRDTNNKWKASESFTCNLSDVTTLIPSKGSSCQHPGFSFLTCTEVGVSNIEGNLALVTISYSGYLSEGDEEEEDDAISYTYELGITTSEEPIETNYRYKDVTAEEKRIIGKVKAGNYTLADETEPYVYIEATNNENITTHTVTSELGRELLDYITSGVTSYLYPSQIWRATFVSDALPKAAILNAVGKITSAQGAPALSDGRNWLFMGCNVSNTDGVFTITYEWKLSGLGGWIEEIYGL